MIEFWQIGMLAETHVHVGEGQSLGAIDMPIARDPSNGIPYIPGSAIKGALRADCSQSGMSCDMLTWLFGPRAEDGDDEVTRKAKAGAGAGALIFQDAVLVALPVRSDGFPFLHVTSPGQIRRLARHRAISGLGLVASAGAFVDRAVCRSAQDSILLEDLRISVCEPDEAFDGLAGNLRELVGSEAVDPDRLVLVHDQVFRWLAAHALPVRARNALDTNKVVDGGALWYEETLPPDTIMSCLFGKRETDQAKPCPLDVLWNSNALSRDQTGDTPRYVQIGGNETVGHGWFQLGRHVRPGGTA